MIMAYKLRSGAKKALEMKHMGTFVGQLVLRGFDRAERVHLAMRCRGYSLSRVPPASQSFTVPDAIMLTVVCVPVILLRFIEIY